MNECRIAVGGVVLGLECSSAEYAASLREYFATGATDETPDVRLKLDVFGDDQPVVVPDSLVATKRQAGDEFTAAGGLVTGRYDPTARRGELRVHWVLTKAQMTRVFEQLLYQAFYSARAARRYDAALMHASGVIRGGAGFLFVGASGAGKSTVADLSQDDTVINDEVCLVEFGGGGPVLHSTPFNGLYRRKQAGRAPLRAVLAARARAGAPPRADRRRGRRRHAHRPGGRAPGAGGRAVAAHQRAHARPGRPPRGRGAGAPPRLHARPGFLASHRRRVPRRGRTPLIDLTTMPTRNERLLRPGSRQPRPSSCRRTARRCTR